MYFCLTIGGYFSFVYDNTKLPDPPDSFADLAARPDDFKIVIQDPRSSTPGLGLVLWIKHIYGDAAADIWRDIAPKILTVTKGWSEAYGMFVAGESRYGAVLHDLPPPIIL